jgi:hypothetical protein
VTPSTKTIHGNATQKATMRPHACKRTPRKDEKQRLLPRFAKKILTLPPSKKAFFQKSKVFVKLFAKNYCNFLQKGI